MIHMLKLKHWRKETALTLRCCLHGRNFSVKRWLIESCYMAEGRVTAERESDFAGKSEVEKARSKGRGNYILPLFCAVLFLACYVSYGLGSAVGSRVAYDSGYGKGHDDGYFDGNFTGYFLGYEVGYAIGNLSGYASGFERGNFSGYALGYDEGYLRGVIDGAGTGYNIRDPTYREMLNFIASDKTDENEYSENYTCIYFVRDVKNHALNEGYRCGFVYIEFPNAAHAIVCFNTTDQGLIFIEPQYDDIVTLKIGQSYSLVNGYARPKYDDTVVTFTIIW